MSSSILSGRRSSRMRLLSWAGDILADAATCRAVIPGCSAASASARVSSDQTIELRFRFSDRLAAMTSLSVISRTTAGILVTPVRAVVVFAPSLAPYRSAGRFALSSHTECREPHLPQH